MRTSTKRRIETDQKQIVNHGQQPQHLPVANITIGAVAASPLHESELMGRTWANQEYNNATAKDPKMRHVYPRTCTAKGGGGDQEVYHMRMFDPAFIVTNKDLRRQSFYHPVNNRLQNQFGSDFPIQTSTNGYTYEQARDFEFCGFSLTEQNPKQPWTKEMSLQIEGHVTGFNNSLVTFQPGDRIGFRAMQEEEMIRVDGPHKVPLYCKQGEPCTNRFTMVPFLIKPLYAPEMVKRAMDLTPEGEESDKRFWAVMTDAMRELFNRSRLGALLERSAKNEAAHLGAFVISGVSTKNMLKRTEDPKEFAHHHAQFSKLSEGYFPKATQERDRLVAKATEVYFQQARAMVTQTSTPNSALHVVVGF